MRGSRSAAAKKAWMARRRDVRTGNVSKRIAEYASFRHEGSGRLVYGTRKQRGETRSAVVRRLGIKNVRPLRGGVLLTRRPSTVPGLSSATRSWIDGLSFPSGGRK